jgi:hypothetical protein
MVGGSGLLDKVKWRRTVKIVASGQKKERPQSHTSNAYKFRLRVRREKIYRGFSVPFLGFLPVPKRSGTINSVRLEVDPIASSMISEAFFLSKVQHVLTFSLELH